MTARSPNDPSCSMNCPGRSNVHWGVWGCPVLPTLVWPALRMLIAPSLLLDECCEAPVSPIQMTVPSGHWILSMTDWASSEAESSDTDTMPGVKLNAPSINLKILCLRLHYWLYQYFYTVWQCKNTVRSYHLILCDSIHNSVWLYCNTVLQYHICSFGQYHMYWIVLTNTIIVRVNRTLHVFWWHWVTVSNTSYSSMSNQIHCIRSRSISISTSINYSFNQYLEMLYQNNWHHVSWILSSTK